MLSVLSLVSRLYQRQNFAIFLLKYICFVQCRIYHKYLDTITTHICLEIRTSLFYMIKFVKGSNVLAKRVNPDQTAPSGAV